MSMERIDMSVLLRWFSTCTSKINNCYNPPIPAAGAHCDHENDCDQRQGALECQRRTHFLFILCLQDRTLLSLQYNPLLFASLLNTYTKLACHWVTLTALTGGGCVIQRNVEVGIKTKHASHFLRFLWWHVIINVDNRSAPSFPYCRGNERRSRHK